MWGKLVMQPTHILDLFTSSYSVPAIKLKFSVSCLLSSTLCSTSSFFLDLSLSLYLQPCFWLIIWAIKNLGIIWIFLLAIMLIFLFQVVFFWVFSNYYLLDTYICYKKMFKIWPSFFVLNNPFEIDGIFTNFPQL